MKKTCKTCGKFVEMFPWEDNCYECQKKKHIADLQEEIEENHETCCEDEIYCPWCGCEIERCEMPEAYEEGDHAIECPNCRKEFALETNVSITYSTKRELPGWILRERKRREEYLRELREARIKEEETNV